MQLHERFSLLSRALTLFSLVSAFSWGSKKVISWVLSKSNNNLNATKLFPFCWLLKWGYKYRLQGKWTFKSTIFPRAEQNFIKIHSKTFKKLHFQQKIGRIINVFGPLRRTASKKMALEHFISENLRILVLVRKKSIRPLKSTAHLSRPKSRFFLLST